MFTQKSNVKWDSYYLALLTTIYMPQWFEQMSISRVLDSCLSGRTWRCISSECDLSHLKFDQNNANITSYTRGYNKLFVLYITYIREDIQYFYAPPDSIGRIYLASKFVYKYFFSFFGHTVISSKFTVISLKF